MYPWICGPLPTGDYLIVIIDEFSRFPVVEITKCLTADKNIPIVDKVFSMFSYPKQIKTNNGPPFNSRQWSYFCSHNNLNHRTVTPLWQQANTQAESFNKPMLKAIRSAHTSHTSWKQALYQFLIMYRCTEHCYTGFRPYHLMFNREPRTELPDISQQSDLYEQVNQYDMKKNNILKSYGDKRNNAKHSYLKEGDNVYMKQRKVNKWSTPYSKTIYDVVKRKGNIITVKDQDEHYNCYCFFINKYVYYLQLFSVITLFCEVFNYAKHASIIIDLRLILKCE